MKFLRTIFLAISVMLIGILSFDLEAYAGPDTDDLIKCMIESTTETDREEIAKWVFSLVAKHPSVKSMSSVSEDKLKETNKKIADLFILLLTDSCRGKASQAIKNDGQIAVLKSFKALQKASVKMVLMSPDIAAVMSDMEDYIKNELQSVLETD